MGNYFPIDDDNGNIVALLDNFFLAVSPFRKQEEKIKREPYLAGNKGFGVHFLLPGLTLTA